MKIIIWAVFLLVLTFWTAMTFVAVHLVEWLAQNFNGTLPEGFGEMINTIPVPPWLAVWVDTNWIESIQSGIVGLIEALAQSMPYLASAIEWLSPLIWGVWALGALFLLTLAGVGHWFVGSFLKPARR